MKRVHFAAPLVMVVSCGRAPPAEVRAPDERVSQPPVDAGPDAGPIDAMPIDAAPAYVGHALLMIPTVLRRVPILSIEQVRNVRGHLARIELAMTRERILQGLELEITVPDASPPP